MLWFLANFGKILKNFKKNWKFLEKIEKYLNQNFSKIFNYEQGKNEKFWKIFLKMSIFWKWFFANISRTVRARAKILVEINPLGHKHTPPDLFPAKNVIIIEFCHGSKFRSFSNENNSKNVGFCRKNWSNIIFRPEHHFEVKDLKVSYWHVWQSSILGSLFVFRYYKHQEFW